MSKIITCPRCNGSGVIKKRINPISTATEETVCPNCKGTGKVRV